MQTERKVLGMLTTRPRTNMRTELSSTTLVDRPMTCIMDFFKPDKSASGWLLHVVDFVLSPLFGCTIHDGRGCAWCHVTWQRCTNVDTKLHESPKNFLATSKTHTRNAHIVVTVAALLVMARSGGFLNISSFRVGSFGVHPRLRGYRRAETDLAANFQTV